MRLATFPICLLLAVSAAAGLSCSLIVDFDLEGKPCGGDHACLDGYHCKIDGDHPDGVCVEGDGPPEFPPDGSVPE